MSKFQTFLSKKLSKNDISKNKFATMIGVTSTYVGQLTNGSKPPPDRKLQIRIAESLDMNKQEKEKFYDNTAKEKNDIPADIYEQILNNPKEWNEIRKTLERKIK